MKPRVGNKARRVLEHAVVMDQVMRNGAKFTERLIRNLAQAGECLVWTGTRKTNGYARMNFHYHGQHVTIDAHRVFLILKRLEPIPIGTDAGHVPQCPHRNCVLHVFSQCAIENAVQSAGKTNKGRQVRGHSQEKGDDCPF